MQLFPKLAVEQKKACAGCRQLVARADCHRNRYDEYICASCQAKGLRFTWRNRLLAYWRRSALTVLIIAVAIVLGALLLRLFFAVFLQLDIFGLVFG